MMRNKKKEPFEYFGGRTQYLESILHHSARTIYFKEKTKRGKKRKRPALFLNQKRETERERNKREERKRDNSPIPGGFETILN